MQRTFTEPKARKSKAKASRKRKPRIHRSVIPPGQTDSPQRRRDILRAAAELFALHGYNSVSLRDIARRAKVPATLCSYYFGPKAELFASVFLHYPDHVKGRRAALESFGGDGTLEDLIRLWIEPLVKMRSNPEGAPFALLSVRAAWDSSDEAQAAVSRFYDPIAFAVLRSLTRLLPDRDPIDLTWGYEWALGAFLMHLGNDRIQSVSRGRAAAGDVGSKIEALIGFVCAGLRSIAPRKSE
jgi:AcrR family transcriptional regulator